MTSLGDARVPDQASTSAPIGTRAPALVVLAVLLLQAAWIATVPPFRGTDEFDHAYRASAVAEGQWRATEPAADGRGLLVAVPPALVEAAHEQCASLSYTGPDNCSAAGDAGKGLVYVGSGAGGYHPAYYWLVGTIAEPFSGSGALYAMRVATALLSTLFVGLAAWSLRRRRTGWPLVAMVVAMSPVLVYSTSIAAPNGPEMAAALALWCSLLAWVHEPDGPDRKGHLAIAVGSAAVMCTLRLLGPLFVVAIVLTVLAYDARGSWAAVRRSRAAVGAGALLVAAVTAAFAWWVATSASQPDDATSEPLEPARRLLVWSLQTIAAFPFRDQPGPVIVYFVVGAAALTLLVAATRASAGTRRAVLLGAFAAAILLPLAATLATLDGRGVIWQGRYGLPYAVGFLILAGVVLDACGWPPSRSWRIAGAVAALGYLVSVAACLIRVRDDELGRAASADDPSWHAPPVVLIVVLVALATVALGTAVATRRPIRD